MHCDMFFVGVVGESGGIGIRKPLPRGGLRLGGDVFESTK